MKASQQFIEFYEDEDQAKAQHGAVIHQMGKAENHWRRRQIPSSIRELLRTVDLICGGDGAVAFVRLHVKSLPRGDGFSSAEAWAQYSQLIERGELPPMGKRQFEPRLKAAMLREHLAPPSTSIQRRGKAVRGYAGFGLKRIKGSTSPIPSGNLSSDMSVGDGYDA